MPPDKVKVILSYDSEAQKGLIPAGGHCLSPATPMAYPPKWYGWKRRTFCQVDGRLIEDCGDFLLVELRCAAGRVVFRFSPCYVNLHGRIRDDEKRFMSVCWRERNPSGRQGMRMADIVTEARIHPDRGFAMLLKWEGKGWWEYGTSPRGGWFTEKGFREVTKILAPFSPPPS